jgi:hypothetical protein
MIHAPAEKATKCNTMRSLVFVWHANVLGVAGLGLEHMH